MHKFTRPALRLRHHRNRRTFPSLASRVFRAAGASGMSANLVMEIGPGPEWLCRTRREVQLWHLRVGSRISLSEYAFR
jgi:hypothetical protein